MGESDSKFSYHPEYTALHFGAHRKPPARIGAPGLCRQVNFWMPSADPGGSAQPAGLKRSNLVDRLLRRLNVGPPGPDPDGPEVASRPYDERRSEWIGHIDEFIAGIVARVTCPTVDPSFSIAPGSTKLRERSYNTYTKTVDGVPTDRLYLFRHSLGFVEDAWELRPIFRPDGVPDCLCHKDHKHGEMDFDKPNMPARYQNFSLAFFWHDVWVKFRFQLHTEYVSLGIYMDLSGSDDLDDPHPLKHEGASQADAGLRDRITGSFQNIGDVCERRYHDIVDGRTEKGRSESDRGKLKCAHLDLYEGIWRDFDEEILEPSLKWCPRGLVWKQIGLVVYDGRIVLLHLPRHESKPRSGRTETAGGPKPPDEPKNFLTEPGFNYARLGRLSDRIALNDVLGRMAAVTCADTMQPFISAPSRKIDSRVEYTANLLLGRRVLYMTSLSAEYTGSDLNFSPAKALLVCKLDHSWQLGRLVDRLFVMGSTRIAALMNLEELIAAGQDLETMTTQLEMEDGRTRDGNIEQLREMEQKWSDLRVHTAALSKKFDGGIERRIERSRYYVQQFREVENTLRLDMVEGFQKYPNFVRQRYFATYDHIDRLGARLTHHQQALARLAQRIVYRNNRLLQSRLLALQVIAELFLIIPLIYYSGHILESGINALNAWVLDMPNRRWAIDLNWREKVWIFPLVLIPVIVFPMAVRHWWELRRLNNIKPDA